MADEWVMIRVRKQTHERLCEAMDRREQSFQKCQMVQWWDGDRLTFDRLIWWLLNQQVRKTERVAESRERARERRRAELLASAWTVIAEADQES